MPPPPVHLDPTVVFGTLDAELPLALLPVRVETRFFLDDDPPELRVRIFPDTVHADGHAAALSPSEQELGRAFWRRTWRTGGDAAGQDAAFAWLVGRIGPWRAAWVARQLAPTNPGQAPTAAVPDGRPLEPAPKFPNVETLVEGGPTWARLLPQRFAVSLLSDEWVFEGTWWGAPIDGDVPLAPGPADVGEDPDTRAWLDGQGLGWTFDFAQAEDVGLGIRIDLSAYAPGELELGFPYLVVCGVRGGDQADALEALLEAHRYTRGLDLIPQGTPTNTTETSGPGLSLEAPDLAALRAAELDAPAATKRPALGAEGVLYRQRGADAACIALGLSRDTALDRAANAGLADLPHAEAMHRALWPALAGYYLDHLLDGMVSADARAWLRDWSVLYARGGASLPTLLVGPQPYGLLPVSPIEPGEQIPSADAGEVRQLEHILALLWSSWMGNVKDVPRLDPEATDVAQDEEGGEGEGEQAARVSKIMASVPHPTGLRLQQVDAKRSEYYTEWGRRLKEVGEAIGGAPDEDGEPYDHYDDAPAWRNYMACLEALVAATTVLEQKAALQALADTLDFYSERDEWGQAVVDHYTEWRDYVQEFLVDFVDQHYQRTFPVFWLFDLYAPQLTGMMGVLGEPSAFFTLHPPEASASWALPLVAAGRSEADVAELQAWLDELAASLEAHWGAANDYTRPFPLLRQLLRRAIEQATSAGDQAVVASGLVGDAATGLAGLAELARTTADPVAEVERLLRETLGVHSHRFDAWLTAIAAWRLENKRQTRPKGIQVGAFGMLTDVRPRETRTPSQGYVLAPSLTHAATAAVLRSGWSSLGSSGESAGLAVDLSSDRVRRARWIVDGVREGQDLARLLGARFERGLHDAVPGLDEWIDDFRKRALRAVGGSAPPNAIVDGLLLARAWSDDDDLTDEEQEAARLVKELLPTTGADRPGIEAVLDSLAADLDAVADAAVAQSVYSLAEGNVPEATATLTAAATGELDFPALRFADTSRPALTVTHRLLLLLGTRAASDWPGAATSGRALAAPSLDAWAAGLLGDPADYPLSIAFADPATGARLIGPIDGTLADLGLAALDVVYLAPVGEQTGLGALGAVIDAWAAGRRPADVPADAVVEIVTSAGDPSMDDLAVVCRQLRRLLAEARDLDGRDLANPGATDVPAGLDVGDLERRVGDVVAALKGGRQRLVAALPARERGPARGDVHAAMLSLGGFSLSAGLPRALAPDTLVAEGRALVAQIDARLAALDVLVAEQTPTWPTLDEVGRRDGLAARMSLLIGHTLPLAPRFNPANAAELDASFARPRLASSEAATAWLAAAGRVDPGARRLRIGVDLVEAARDGVRFDFALGQLPDHEDEGWAATERPSHDERGRLCLLATGTRTTFAADAAAGLVLGAWTEAVPRRKQTAALAVHFDAPSARAPQTILLGTTKPERGWDFELVRDMVLRTLDLARLRMVGPETLANMGQYLPAAYLHVDTPATGST